MTMSIWKFPLEIKREIDLIMPAGSWILTVQTQDGTPTIWARIDDQAKASTRRLQFRGTGHNADDVGVYVGTVQVPGGLVFHLFDKGEI